MPRTFALTVLIALGLPVVAVAAPWDGPRSASTVDGDVPLFVVPRAFTVTFEPGVQASTSPSSLDFTGPEVLDVDGILLERVDRVGPARLHTVEYRTEAEVAPGRVARALAARADVRAAAPLFRLADDELAPWRAATSDLLLGLDDPNHEGRMLRLAESMGLEAVTERAGPAGSWLLRLTPDATVDVVEAAMNFREQPWVRWAQADWMQPREERHTPADELFGEQWHLNNTGQSGGDADNDVNATEAWDITRGDPEVIVAIQDSGVQLDHEDLQEALIDGYDFVDGDDDPGPSGSHGTSVAGVSAAPENGTGVVGVCSNCTILPIRVIGANDSGEADAHIFSVDNGAWVINNSWGPPDGTGSTVPMGPAMAAAVEYAHASGRGGRGTAIFWAAGNGHPTDTCDEDGYASHPDVIAVGASTNRGERSGYSETCAELDVSAPSNGGSAGLRTTRTGNGYTSSFGGTSGAAPVAAGVGAIVLHALPDLTASQLQSLLEATAQKIDPQGGEWDDQGHSIHYGWGRVDAAAALQSQLAFLDVPVSLAGCSTAIPATVSIPSGEGQGLGRVEVTAWSDAEATPETLVLTEGSPGTYSGEIPITEDAPTSGDGRVSVRDGGTLVVASADSETQRTVDFDCGAPEISSVTVTQVTSEQALVGWLTDEAADSLVRFGEDDREVFDPDLTTLHQVLLVDLEPCTQYRVNLESADVLGNVGRENNAESFRTDGDPAVLPDDAQDDADPCDPSTWAEATPEEPTPGPGVNDLTSGDDDGCACRSSMTGSASAAGLSGLLLLGVRRRR